MDRVITLVRTARTKPVGRFVVGDDASVPIGVMMRIEAVRRSECHQRHQQRGRDVACALAESIQHRTTTVELRSSGVKVSLGLDPHA